jgi:hypothetical protein
MPMSQLTIDLPDDLMAFVNRKAHEGFESPENFVRTLVEMSRLEEEVEKENSAHPHREALEDILEARDKGPFIPLPSDWKEQVLEKAR